MTRMILGLCAAAFLISFTASCSNDGMAPTAPASPEWSGLSEAPPRTGDLGAAVDPDIRPATNQISRRVSASLGATIQFSGLTLRIPPSALPQDQTITVRVLSTGRQVEYDLLPHGLYFLEPAELRIETAKTRTGAARATTLFAMDESRGVWVDLGASFSSKSTVLAAKLDHLTRVRAGVSMAPRS